MHAKMSDQFRQAMKNEIPLQIVGAINAFTALMAKDVGFRALYLSGAGVANISYGLPDTGIITFDNILEDAKRIVHAVDLPLIVDIDTGFEENPPISTVIERLCKIGVAGIHLEDQMSDKRCGHLEGKRLVSKEEMCLKLNAAFLAKQKSDLVIIARTDALLVEGIEKAIDRAIAYKEAGAEIIFPESLKSLEQYTLFKNKLNMPILANLTEFGKTPLFTIDELKNAGVDIVLYPLSASRAMNKAALEVYQEIKKNGSQKNLLHKMQTRNELYQFLKYDPVNESR